MTDEELIEQIARTVGQKIEGAAEDMDSVWYGAPLWVAYIEEARAILPFIHADREAIRAEQAAELAKFKALAETLAGAVRRIHKTASHPTNPSRNLVDIKFVSDLALHNYDAAMRQYKEARDAS